MDLREKPGKVQTVMELLLRFRLISVVAIVVASATFVATKWQEIVSLPLGASEALGMWIAEIEDVASVWASAQYLAVAGIAAVVLFFVFGGIRSGFASIISFALAFGALFLLGGNEEMPLMMMGGLALVAALAMIVLKLSVACGLFPFVLGWCFFSGLMAALPEALEPSWRVWALLSALGFAGSMALSVSAGKHLGAGVPQAGSLVKAAKQTLMPMLLSSFVVLGALAFDMYTAAVATGAAGEAAEAAADVVVDPMNNVWGAVLYFFVFNVWFFGFVYPTMSFAPWERLRAGSRRVEMKDKKKKTEKKGDKKSSKK
ncbi:MAG: hypothetical protein MJZ05_04525 [Fibrobacter sp.]|nr:hypothetical protein [Fibrobacter sp.]